MGTSPPDARVRNLLDRAVAAGVLTVEQADAVAALDLPLPEVPLPEVPAAEMPVAEMPVAEAPAPPATPAGPATPAAGEGRRGAVLAEVLGYLGGALAVVAALFLGAEVWDDLGPWPRTLLLAVVAVACLAAGAALGGRDGAAGRLGGFLWAAAVAAVAGTVGVGVDGLLGADGDTAALVAATAALVVAAVLWWRRPAVLQHIATFAAAVATLFALLDRLGDGTFGWGGPLLWVLGGAWLAASAFPLGDRTPGAARSAGLWRPAEPGWVLGAFAVVAGPLFAEHGRAAWLVAGAVCAAALVVVGVRTRRPWVAAVGTGGVFLSVPLAVAEVFDARLGPLIGVLVVGLGLVAVAVVLTRRAAR